MSTFRRWKEEQIRHHIYLDQLNTAQNFSDGALFLHSDSIYGSRGRKRSDPGDEMVYTAQD